MPLLTSSTHCQSIEDMMTSVMLRQKTRDMECDPHSNQCITVVL